MHNSSGSMRCDAIQWSQYMTIDKKEPLYALDNLLCLIVYAVMQEYVVA